MEALMERAKIMIETENALTHTTRRQASSITMIRNIWL